MKGSGNARRNREKINKYVCSFLVVNVTEENVHRTLLDDLIEK